MSSLVRRSGILKIEHFLSSTILTSAQRMLAILVSNNKRT